MRRRSASIGIRSAPATGVARMRRDRGGLRVIRAMPRRRSTASRSASSAPSSRRSVSISRSCGALSPVVAMLHYDMPDRATARSCMPRSTGAGRGPRRTQRRGACQRRAGGEARERGRSAAAVAHRRRPRHPSPCSRRRCGRARGRERARGGGRAVEHSDLTATQEPVPSLGRDRAATSRRG